jgi:hypothetical protein
MWKRIGLFSSLLAAALVGDAFAQSPDAKPCAHPAAGSLWNQVDWLRLEISGGRLVVHSTRCGHSRLAVEPTPVSAARQTLTIDSRPAALLVNYQLTDEQGTLSLQVDERKQLTLTHQPATEGGPTIHYVQPAVGKVCQTIGAQGGNQTDAASLWHLLLAEPQCRQSLAPLLAKLRPDWQITEKLAAIERALVDRAGTDVAGQRQAWQAAVDQLADSSFARRSEADRSLRATGRSVQSFLREIDLSGLDREQRRRVLSILESVSDANPDSPERVAGWLVDDKQVWLALLNRGELHERVAAARHLALLHGQTVSFEPAASPLEQEQQLVQLKALLAEN